MTDGLKHILVLVDTAQVSCGADAQQPPLMSNEAKRAGDLPGPLTN